MSVVVIDGRVKVTLATAVANVAAPTVAEANAGTSVQGFITPDGLEITPATGKANVSNLGSKQTAERAGRRSYAIKIKFHHDAPTDTPYNLLPYNTDLFLIVRRGVDATQAWAAGDKVEVYPINTGEPEQDKPVESGTWDFSSPMFVSADANTRAVMA